ncbi:hypothetical protein LTR35_004937 [Friedmanniomyces endolithicus]|uniref:RNase III domain-containing protein n=1 Tax=Friedmanniomyces endolithicus TaxID=329885 RepID=A0AAN6G454_9PEZI|nr:hypothetical protein LTR35_004937 [Friedmanniomyces endolithicus]KAK0298928.1 hypothetical protein LTS00_002690 [Friedmanniomyces endolithicus]KAK0328920.1 hypothetical protein LTR82_000853 [Friedmanniomyces endolithicus]KAK1003853.1 hypothetical protein LTR54_007617 [Friedmanniomyces endolithicus]
MTKRPPSEDHAQPQHKKQKHDDNPHHRNNRNHNGNREQPRPQHRNGNGRADGKHRTADNVSHYEEALSQLPKPTTTLPPVAAYIPFTVPKGLPPLPEINDPNLATAPFRHRSTTTSYNRSRTDALSETTYEKLEFLGDAQLEHLASRLLYTHFPHLTAGQLSQLRELLVKNETLAEYARLYGFDSRVQVQELERMLEHTKDKAGNKGFNKVLGDVFEAFVAAVVLSHGDEGFAVAEKWMQALWAPKLVEAARREKYLTPGLGLVQEEGGVDPLRTYNTAGKAELQRMLLGGARVKLEYEVYQRGVELKGDQLGQNKHFIAVYLTGYGYVRKLLGKGEGKNKVEAGNWAAQEAMYGECKGVVEECARQMAETKEKRRKEREEREAAEKEKVAGE